MVTLGGITFAECDHCQEMAPLKDLNEEGECRDCTALKERLAERLEPVQCPWCGANMSEAMEYEDMSYDSALEAHVDECTIYQQEQGS